MRSHRPTLRTRYFDLQQCCRRSRAVTVAAAVVSSAAAALLLHRVRLHCHRACCAQSMLCALLSLRLAVSCCSATLIFAPCSPRLRSAFLCSFAHLPAPLPPAFPLSGTAISVLLVACRRASSFLCSFPSRWIAFIALSRSKCRRRCRPSSKRTRRRLSDMHPRTSLHSRGSQ